ncbi:alpha-1,3-mannosyl-glycoprotein 4-beta-N-acetylglucosaminyltransferase C isoform X1 [Phyllobates terribilis]|uniref:alpha-1,3-mannosyl-glycoprotein 4-beta-N-acetylglucosaminyltransferase C isoform X1 n=1 Tax=Phyllobates terribilis TaxID=111132 RepID=UPI003CCAEBFF
MIRCMLTDSKLPEKYWGEAAMTATYLQNRLFSRKLTKTPYELWKGMKPSVNQLKLFRCKVFIFIPTEKRSKLQNRSMEGIFVGYSENCKGYRILDTKTDRVTMSSSVTFIEDLNEDIMISVETKNEKNNSDITEEISDEKEVEINEEQNTESEESQLQTDTEPRRSMRENKGKPPKHLSYKTSIRKIYEPTSWENISKPPEEEANKWIEATETEIKSMHDSNTWTLTDLPEGRKAIGYKWIFKVKYQTDGTAERYRARLIAKEYSQKYGEDYDETFAPVVKHTTIRTLLTVAAMKQMELRHLDVNTAFLNGDLAEDIYMEQPPGLKDERNPNKVCKLQKSIYGLKQAAKAWNDKITEVLTNEKFQRSKANPCLYTKRLINRWIYVLIYVDDILICFKQERDKENILKILKQHLEIKDLGNVKQYLGIQVEREEDGSFLLNQNHMIQDITEKFGLKDAKTVKSPMETNYLKEMNSEKNILPNNEEYRTAIGKYLATVTRPDISAAVGILSRKVSKPNKAD